MPRQVAVSPEQMAARIASWLRRLGREADRAEALDRFDLLAAYPDAPDASAALVGEHGRFAALTWIDAHAARLSRQDVDSLLSSVKVRAGNSEQKVLWRERVVFIDDLGCYLRLPTRVPKWVLTSATRSELLPTFAAPRKKGASSDRAAPPSPYLVTLANKPSVLIDRATRGSHGWDGASLQYRPALDDGLVLNYFEENAAPEVLRQHLQTLDPRTSDVWRLLTAKALESERDDVFAPITIRPAELARALGLKPHPNGSMRPKDVVRCTESLFHLERLWLTVPDARTPDEEGTRERVLAVMKRGKARKVDGQSIPSSWTVVLGEWARYFPKSYAPIFRSLVELPANTGTNLWTKQIGTELTYLIRETFDDPGRVRIVQVRALLARASVLHEALEMREHRNHHRAIERLEAALDLLRSLGVHDAWRYEAHSARLLDAAQGQPGFFEAWLECFVEITVSESLLQSVASLAERPASSPATLG